MVDVQNGMGMEKFMGNDRTVGTENEKEKFLKAVKLIQDYWVKHGESIEHAVAGALFSTLVMLDGDSSVNDFHTMKIIDTTTGKEIIGGNLHDFFAAM